MSNSTTTPEELQTGDEVILYEYQSGAYGKKHKVFQSYRARDINDSLFIAKWKAVIVDAETPFLTGIPTEEADVVNANIGDYGRSKSMRVVLEHKM